MVYATLKKLRAANACKRRYTLLRRALGQGYGDNTPISLVQILQHSGIDDALWVPKSALTGTHIQRRYRLFAVACCQDVLRLMGDQRSRDTVRVVHLYAYGEATEDELRAAWDAAWDAAMDAGRESPWYTARVAAASAKDTAWDAAMATVEATRDAVWAIAWGVARAAGAAKATALATANDAEAGARKRQTEHFRIIFSADFDEGTHERP